VLGSVGMAALTPSRPHTAPPSDHPVLDTVLGRLLEWMVQSVEEVRARLDRRRTR